jgi:hypothetical protein
MDENQAKFGVVSNQFGTFGTFMSMDQTSIDLFVITQKQGNYRNLMTMVEMCRRTSGMVYYYP